jgi:hypothetical protein
MPIHRWFIVKAPRHQFRGPLEPLKFIERLAALLPLPRLHLIRFHAVLAPNAKLRSKIVPARQSAP